MTREQETPEADSTPPRRYVLPADGSPRPPLVTEDVEEELTSPVGLSRWTMVVSGGMAVLAGLGLVAAMGFSDEATVTRADREQIASLHTQITQAERTRSQLPPVGDARRGLVAASEAAHAVAEYQNDYRILATTVTHGHIPAEGIKSTKRSLVPFFTTSTKRERLEPWYLLASDAKVSQGTGLPDAFDSGFTWQAGQPASIAPDGSIEVTWLATARDSGEVLAVARANYDITTATFSSPRVSMTAAGDALALGVVANAD